MNRRIEMVMSDDTLKTHEEANKGMNNCNNCRWANWVITKAGRRHPSGDGHCDYPVVVPTLPSAYYQSRTPAIYGGYINRQEPKKNCPCFKEIEQ
jgi:hypothetical protein